MASATPRLITDAADTLVALLRDKTGAEKISQEAELASRLAAAVDCQAALARALAAAEAEAGASQQNAGDLTQFEPQWLRDLARSLPSGLGAFRFSGCTPLAVACWLGQLDCAKCLLALRADANAVDASGMQEGIRPVTPLSAALLSTAAQPNRRRAIVELLLRHGADPLAPSLRRRYIALRCATGLQEGSQHSIRTLLLDRLEQQHAAGRPLAFRTGAAAADVMLVAARCGRVLLFRLAHEFVLGASGHRPCGSMRGGSSGGAAAAAAGRRLSPDGSSSSGSDEDEGGNASGGKEAVAAVAADALLQRSSSSGTRRWRPSRDTLCEVLRLAVVGGSGDILRTAFTSPLPFSAQAADRRINGGLLLVCASRAPNCAAAMRVLHAAGAELELRTLLWALEAGLPAATVAALVACPCVEVPASAEASLKIRGTRSFSCPIHRMLCIWKRGPGSTQHAAPATDPAAWRREVVRVLEVLLVAGYRPTVYQVLLCHPPLPVHGGGSQIVPPFVDKWPFDPFACFHASGRDDAGVLLLARQGSWDCASHRCWPERFQAVVRTLLLASPPRAGPAEEEGAGARRQTRQGSKAARLRRPARASASGWAALPQELVLPILAQAAMPMSSWM